MVGKGVEMGVGVGCGIELVVVGLDGGIGYYRQW